MGGTHSQECNHVSQQIWEWAITQDIWLSTAYIPGDSNVVADFHSRCFHENKEWALKETGFALLKHTYGSPGIDLLASSTNAKIPLYISWLPEPNAYAVDRVVTTWKNLENPGKSWNWASPPGKSWNFAKCLKILENRSIFLKNLEFEVKKKKKNYILMINTHFEYSHTHPSHIHTHTHTLTFNDLIFFHVMCLLWYI